MNQHVIKVLVVDDDEDDFVLARDLLSQIVEPKFETSWCSSYGNALDRFKSESYDIYLVDYRLGEQNGLELIRAAQEFGCQKPMILLTGQGDHDADISAIKFGASDYLLKDQINTALLERSIRYALDRKQVESELWESEEKYRALSENSPDIILRFDREFRYLYANSAIRTLTDRAPAEFMGKSLADMPLGNQDTQEWSSQLTDVFVVGESRQTQVEWTLGSNCVFFDLRLIPELSAGGEVESVMVTMRDITEIKRLQQFTSRAQRLETAGRIAGQVAHDFNNLLGPLVAYPDLMEGTLPAEHPARRYCARMRDSARQMSEINQQLLTLGRRGHYNLEPLNLNNIILQAVEQVSSTTDVTPAIALELDDQIMNVQGGSAQILRVICNLLVNACDAMPDGGNVTIRTENRYVDCAYLGRIGRIPAGEYVKLTIADKGSGIAPDILSKIFDPFYTTKEAGCDRGSGLGLSVVHAVIEDHDGVIDCDTEVGKGTSMYVYLPITRDRIEIKVSDKILGGDERILVVDDDEVQREVSSMLLRELGYQVIAVPSGEESVKLLASQSQDIVILDMIMPGGMDGGETLREILKINPDQKVIIVSGYAESRRVSEALELGAGTFIRKPLTLRSIAQAVRIHLDKNKQPAPIGSA